MDCSRQPRWVLVVMWACACWATGLMSRSAVAWDEGDTLAARGLVAKLGDASFVVRKRAMSDLAAMGLPALPALVEGSRSSNREIRYRSQYVLEIVRDLDFQRRLVMFLSDPDSAKYQLPGWKRFRELVGVSAGTKQVFVAMQKAEAALMAETAGSGRQLSVMLTNAAMKYVSGAPKDDTVPVGLTAAILFAASDPRVPITTSLGRLLYRMAADSRSSANIRGRDAAGEVTRALLLAFLERYAKVDAYPALSLSLNYGMPEALGFAVSILEGNTKTASVREVALLTVNRYGNKKHVSVVAPFLGDDQTIARSKRIDGQIVKYRVQVRDVALATLLTLVGEDHAKHGFPHVRTDELRVFNVRSLEFASDGDRQAAITAWKKRHAGPLPARDMAP